MVRSVLIFALLCSPLLAAEPTVRKWTVDGVEREALVALPAKAKESPRPLVFVFHGHGGTHRQIARQFAIHTHWPEAIVVYPQGLKTPGRLTDPDGKKNGWQHAPGDQEDRDLKFFDAMLKSLKADYTIDDARIYSTGHSNGGGFTYLLWGQRGDVFAAFAPSAAVANPRRFGEFKPKPVLHLGAENDPLVKFTWQKAGLDQIKTINSAASAGKPWGDVKFCTIYESKTGTPVVTHLTDGKHSFAKDGGAVIVKFFKDQVKK